MENLVYNLNILQYDSCLTSRNMQYIQFERYDIFYTYYLYRYEYYDFMSYLFQYDELNLKEFSYYFHDFYFS